MRRPNRKETGSSQSEFLAEAVRNWLRWQHGTRLTEPGPCPDCDEQNYRKHDFKERIFAMLITEEGFEEITVEFPVYIDCTYQNGRYDEHGVVRHGYVVDAMFIDSPREVRYHYGKRFGIESSYRLSEQSIATTSTQNPVIRLLYVVVSLLLQNVWRYLHWEHVATPRRGGRRLWQWSFKEFINMVRRAAGTALAVRRAVPANRPPEDRFYR